MQNFTACLRGVFSRTVLIRPTSEAVFAARVVSQHLSFCCVVVGATGAGVWCWSNSNQRRAAQRVFQRSVEGADSDRHRSSRLGASSRMVMAMSGGVAADYGTGQERRESTNRAGRRPGRRAKARQKARRHGAAYGQHTAGASIVTAAAPGGSRERYGWHTVGALTVTAATPRAKSAAGSAGNAEHRTERPTREA